MGDDEIFDSAVRPAGDRAGVFEYDGDTGYFYLCDTKESDGHEGIAVIAAIRVFVGSPDFAQQEIAVRSSSTESIVGLFIRGSLWAAFDPRTGGTYGGNDRSDSQPAIPADITDTFKST